jgi:Holliday junction resolvasome RuvABC endonuclease subunit
VRIAKIYHRIEDALDEYEPDLVVFEDIQMQQGNVATF